MILGFLAWKLVDFEEFGRSITALSPGAAVLLVLFSGADRWLMAVKWRHLGRALGLPAPGAEYVRAYWAASFLSYCLPTTLAGEVYRGFRVTRASDRATGVVATMILEKLLGVLATVLLAWAGLVWLLVSGAAPDARTILLNLLIASVAVAAVFVLAFAPATHRVTVRWLGRIGAGGPATKLIEALEAFRAMPGTVLGNLGLAIVENALQIGLTWGAAHALGIVIPTAAFVAIVAVTQLLRRLTMIFDGWGLSEALRLLTYGLVGVSGSDTLAMSLLGHAAMGLASLPGALVFLRDPDRSRLEIEAGEEAAAHEGSLDRMVRRFLTPPIVATLIFWVRDHAKVSWRSEVEVTPNLHFGRGCHVSSFVKIKATDGPIVIGERSGFATGCFVSAGEKGITIGRNVLFGPNVTVLGQAYRYEHLDVPFEDQGTTSKGVRIGNNVWIGAGSTITDGAVIGDNTIVVANSLVNRRYPDNVIIQGAPAKILLRRGREADPPGRRTTPCETASSPSSAQPSTT